MAKIMVVDDDEDFASAVALVLRTCGHDVRVAYDTRSGLEQMTADAPDVAIIDVMFPEDNNAGFKLTRAMKDPARHLSHVPILMLTALNEKSPVKFSSEDIDETWLPITDFLEKPVDLDVLKNRVAALLQKTI